MAAGSSNKLDTSALDVCALREDLKYIQATNVNVSNFVSVKLSNKSNYRIWKAQMLCLIRSQRLRHIINAKSSFPEDKGVQMIEQYDELVKGWIFGSVNEEVLKDLVDLKSAQEVWRKLKSTFNPPKSNKDTEDSVEFGFGIESLRDVPEIENTDRRKRLYEAAIEGCWWKAKSILKIHNNAATEAITENGNTILHLAVQMGHNYFVEKLLDFIKDGKDIAKQNDKGRTALHIAALAGNAHAGRLLVQKRKELLVVLDYNEVSPLTISDTSLNLSLYLLKSALSTDLIPHDFDDEETETMAITAIAYNQYDLARTLLGKYHNAAKKDYSLILMALTETFPTNLGFTESFIYPSFNNVCQKTFARCSLFFQNNFLDKYFDDISRVVNFCNNACYNWLGSISMILVVPIGTLYPIYQMMCLLIVMLRLIFSMLYFFMWKVLVITVRPIKNIEKKKKVYKEAREILTLICDQMGTSNDDYNDPIVEAARKGVYEVVDEILFRSPKTINCKNEEGHNIIQIAIINRSEKLYNLIHHIIEHVESYSSLTDSYENNLAHLAGRLAPSFVLDRTTGAALQLQRELQWHEEVKKLILPIELINRNIYEETPAMVFTKEHKELLKEGENWMKTTAESSSITAALIVTIVFAAAITVPGGSNQETGIPLFRKEIVFAIFAVFNAFSLFTAATALLLFLSILTARFTEKDFLVTLPRRMVFGLLMLFISTTTMIVAFGAILFLVFCDQRPWLLAPIGGFVCLPISVIVFVKVPLLVDLIQSTYFPIFGEKSYLEPCKINRKNTLYKD